MEEKIYSITLTDGTVLTNLKMNGNNYISQETVTEEIFNCNCSPITISDGTNDEVHDDMELVQITEMSGAYWFVLRDVPREELDRIKLRSDVEYVAMMSGIEL